MRWPVRARSRHAAPAVLLLAGLLALVAPAWAAPAANGIIVYETDYGLKDGAVSAMRGVARSVAPGLVLEDLTHEIPAFNVWEAAYRLDQTAAFWPAGTVFVVVVDPDSGTERRDILLVTRSGHYFLAPDNGALTLVAERLGVEQLRRIDVEQNRRPGSDMAHLTEGRDLFAYAAARLAAGQIEPEAIGPALDGDMFMIEHAAPAFEDGKVSGMIPVLDVQYGNVWTNIDRATFDRLGLAKGDLAKVVIKAGGEVVYEGDVPYVDTFSDVAEGDELLYFNSQDDVSLAINYGDFAGTAGIGSGPEWTIEIGR